MTTHRLLLCIKTSRGRLLTSTSEYKISKHNWADNDVLTHRSHTCSHGKPMRSDQHVSKPWWVSGSVGKSFAWRKSMLSADNINVTTFRTRSMRHCFLCHIPEPKETAHDPPEMFNQLRENRSLIGQVTKLTLAKSQ